MHLFPWEVRAVRRGRFSSPFFLRAIKRLDATKRESLRATDVTSISSSSPSFPPPRRPPSKTWSRKCNFFNLAGRHGSAAHSPPACRRCPAQGNGGCVVRASASWVVHSAQPTKYPANLLPLYKWGGGDWGTANNAGHKIFYFIFCFPRSLSLFRLLLLYLPVEWLTKTLEIVPALPECMCG